MVQFLFSGIYFDIPQDYYFHFIILMTFHNPWDNKVFDDDDNDDK